MYCGFAALLDAVVISVFDSRLNVFFTTDSQNPFIVDMNAIIMTKIIINAAIPFVRAFHIDILYFLCHLFVTYGPGTLTARQPPIIFCPGYPEWHTGLLNRIFVFLAIFLDNPVKVLLSYL